MQDRALGRGVSCVREQIDCGHLVLGQAGSGQRARCHVRVTGVMEPGNRAECSRNRIGDTPKMCEEVVAAAVQLLRKSSGAAGWIAAASASLAQGQLCRHAAAFLGRRSPAAISASPRALTSYVFGAVILAITVSLIARTRARPAALTPPEFQPNQPFDASRQIQRTKTEAGSASAEIIRSRSTRQPPTLRRNPYLPSTSCG